MLVMVSFLLVRLREGGNYSSTAKCCINDRIIDNNVSQFPFLEFS